MVFLIGHLLGEWLTLILWLSNPDTSAATIQGTGTRRCVWLLWACCFPGAEGLYATFKLD
ncbi:hypothetical protein NW755_002022 [Fusarium falciforme]|uniref:Uncharacterized protein n=1 Tax=Fusarium falciforme TaxID=195108 RepID=A0A9W8REE1_9HYPO|nr:hypothetical protein NW755_002022 [Fusarium falciforme]